MQTRISKRRSLAFTELAFGGAPLGGLYEAVSDAAALEALECAWDAGVRYFDTAPLYGFGLSEQRLGTFLRTKPRDAYVLSTKVGRVLKPSRGGPDTSGSLGAFVGALPNDAVFDFSADAIRRSFESSLERLGVDHIDVVYLHDPDDHYESAVSDAYPVLHALRDEGCVRAIGAGMNQWQMLERLVRNCDLDAVLLAGRYTLLDRSGARTLLPLCLERGIAVLAAGVFNSGILAQPVPADGATYDYVPAAPDVLARARTLARICARNGVSMPAAALQFPLRHPAVAAVIVGMRSAREVRLDLGYREESIPSHVWTELEAVADGVARA